MKNLLMLLMLLYSLNAFSQAEEYVKRGIFSNINIGYDQPHLIITFLIYPIMDHGEQALDLVIDLVC